VAEEGPATSPVRDRSADAYDIPLQISGSPEGKRRDQHRRLGCWEVVVAFARLPLGGVPLDIMGGTIDQKPTGS
jgi:hypothetical protein